MASLAAGVVLQSADVHAESFEVISYTPPRGWAAQNVQEGKAYVRPDGTGSIVFYASRPDASPAPEAFATMWRTQVEPAVPVPAPASFNGVRPHSIPRINVPAHSHSPFTNLLSHTTHSATIR